MADVRRHDPEADETYITSGEVARILRVSPKTVARWAKEGRLPHLGTLGGHWRFPATPIYDLARKLHVRDGPEPRATE